MNCVEACRRSYQAVLPVFAPQGSAEASHDHVHEHVVPDIRDDEAELIEDPIAIAILDKLRSDLDQGVKRPSRVRIRYAISVEHVFVVEEDVAAGVHRQAIEGTLTGHGAVVSCEVYDFREEHIKKAWFLGYVWCEVLMHAKGGPLSQFAHVDHVRGSACRQLGNELAGVVRIRAGFELYLDVRVGLVECLDNLLLYRFLLVCEPCRIPHYRLACRQSCHSKNDKHHDQQPGDNS